MTRSETTTKRAAGLLLAGTLLAGTMLAGTVALGLSGCSTGTSPATVPADGALSGPITVFAAASLRSTFTQLADQFEADNPGTSIRLNFAGSSDLATQILEGAPADVFASADETTMDRIVDADLVDGVPSAFASNVLEIAVPKGNPAGIATFADLGRGNLKLVICAPEVPCGAATTAVEELTGVALRPVSEEQSVTDVLGKVTSGEADAGLVYATDVLAAGDAVDGIPFDESGDAVTVYPIAALARSEAAGSADAFVAFVTGETGQSVLADAGFGEPPAS